MLRAGRLVQMQVLTLSVRGFLPYRSIKACWVAAAVTAALDMAAGKVVARRALMALFNVDPRRLEDVAADRTGVRHSNLTGVPPVLAQGAPGASPWPGGSMLCALYGTRQKHGVFCARGCSMFGRACFRVWFSLARVCWSVCVCFLVVKVP